MAGVAVAAWLVVPRGQYETGANSAEKVALVERVKAFQKVSRANAKVWSVFTDATKTRNRLDVTKLLEF